MANEQTKRKPKARKARQKIRDDVRRGKMTKPSSCSSCGKPVEKSKLSAHHTSGYGNKKTVQWLCHRCHAKANARTAGQDVN